MNENIENYLSSEDPYKQYLWGNAVENLSKKNAQNDFFLKLPVYLKQYLTEPVKATKLEIAALLFYRYITFIDAVIDGDMQKGRINNKNIVLQATYSIMLGSIELSEYLRNNMALWSLFSEKLKLYLDIITLEKEIFGQMSMDLKMAKSIALGKHSLFFFYFDCIISNENPDKFELEKLLSNIIFSIQILDDINDIDKDFENSILTYPISELNSFFISNNISDKTFNLTYLCITDVATGLLKQVMELLNESCKIAMKLKLSKLHSEVITLIEYTETKLQTITTTKKYAAI